MGVIIPFWIIHSDVSDEPAVFICSSGAMVRNTFNCDMYLTNLGRSARTNACTSSSFRYSGEILIKFGFVDCECVCMCV